MKKILIVSVMMVSVLLSSCTKQLDLNPKDALNTGDALSTIKGVNSAILGMYASMRSVNYYGRSLYIYGDLSGNDVYLSKANSNRYLSTFQRTYAANDADPLAMWTAMYATISRANNIINSVDKVSATQAEKDLAKGQALFIRALGYFDLVRVFAKPYNQGNGAQLGVPIVLVSDITAYPARNTVADVYSLIINDLNAAKTLLASTTATDKVTASKFAASALLSRVYLYKGDNANAILEANAVIGNTGFAVTPAADLPSFYSSTENDEEIFTVKFLSTESLGSDNIGNIYLKPGYGDVRVSPDLVNVFDKVNDVRYTSFISAFSNSPTEFQNNKYKQQDGAQGMYSPKVLRLSEIILNRAEAENKVGGKDAEALIDLNSIRSKRGLAPLSGLTGANLLNAILLERRKELMFEGQSFFDLMRNGITMQRNFCNDPLELTSPQCSLIATDPKTIAPIPQTEISANPSLNGQQNTGY
ncbi:RagB/SusD family nutrient uptake outer membrane protein [Pedobacter punctiformis]|uniref:RagB/SusD family nutrient uptake outer membrane protein n=1 Tax=Pedobacter punctiformis TaxID=3004097 RepID=A0ABT4L685_9SPHI|nr:RagB/SusD family nutrient uptake outer membrane protein [Pedobacter sp. HCMS5-2]MCZ4243418.1 RagB/SusD family nutrient uptake outer membrane protein [Pedobacter sp. HCMS5-2]